MAYILKHTVLPPAGLTNVPLKVGGDLSFLENMELVSVTV